ncbi:hypothetical protein HDU80_003436, partial [Chytriomyces hyalinus]
IPQLAQTSSTSLITQQLDLLSPSSPGASKVTIYTLFKAYLDRKSYQTRTPTASTHAKNTDYSLKEWDLLVASRKRSISRKMNNPTPHTLYLSVELKHFELQTAIGKGAFGKVKLVQHKNTKEKYALKYIDKKMCVEMKAVDCIIQERFLLEDVHSTFICNLRYAFQDDENMFMVIDLALGGDLRYLLNTKGPLSEDLVRFYMAESSLGIKYLHSQSIVHRDLKPDNILISEKGHVLLTDFNIATRFKADKPMKSEAGSPAYMAPEMFFRKGYNCTIDWWSLGVIQYELLLGKRPFESNSSDGLKKAIMNDEITFKGNREISADTQDVIKAFLCRDPTKR